MRLIRLLGILIVLLIITTGCQPPVINIENIDSYSSYVVAEIDTVYSLTMPELYEALNNSTLLPNGGTLPVKDVKHFLDSLVVDTIISLLAFDVNPADYYDQYQDVKREYQDYLTKLYYRRTVYDKINVDSAQAARYWAEHPEFFSIPEQVLLYHIFISPLGMKYTPDSLYYRSLTPEELDRETEKYARRVKEILDSVGDFQAVAKEYSQDLETVRSGGKVGWVKRGIYKHPFDSVAFNLEPGNYSDLYRDSDGWHIIYIEDYKPGGPPPLDSLQLDRAKKMLTAMIADSLARPIIDSLKNEIHLVYNEPMLDTNVFHVDKQVWAGILNGIDTIDFNDLRQYELAFRRKYGVSNTTVDMKREMIELVARRYIVMQAARAMGLDTLDYVRAVYNGFRQKFGRLILHMQCYDIGWNPPDSLVEQYFETHKKEFEIKKPLKVQHIITDDSLFGEFIRDQAMAGVDFLELAQQYYPGDEEVRKDLANLGEIGPEDVPPEFYQAALMTTVGEVSHPVKTKYGYHIIKVLAKRNPPDYLTMRPKIVPILKKQHRMEAFRQFRDSVYNEVQVRFPGKLYPVHLRSMRYRSK